MGNSEKGGKSVLLESVTKAQNWSALADLKNSTPSGRREIVANVFMEACVHHDDENACQLFGWLLLAFLITNILLFMTTNTLPDFIF